ncbi:MAG: hypothetical protein JW850_07855 [Thermoflexales bacterium]|nr:hypothetical protein [Thermoflexales bacterium]
MSAVASTFSGSWSSGGGRLPGGVEVWLRPALGRWRVALRAPLSVKGGESVRSLTFVALVLAIEFTVARLYSLVVLRWFFHWLSRLNKL